MYYLLSRSLGPEFGGSIGLIYFLGTVIGCGMNVLGFVEPLIANFGESSGTVYRVLPEGKVRYLISTFEISKKGHIHITGLSQTNKTTLSFYFM